MTTLRRSLHLPCGILLVILASALHAQVEPADQYQNRGDHWEGVKPEPIAGSIALVEAHVDLGPPSDAWPERLRLRFYLAEASEAHLVVRELKPRTSYWLDRAQPTVRSAGFKEFTWPTATVLRRLTELRPADLGAVVRLGTAEASRHERVAPALLCDAVPARVPGYRFTFRLDAAARVHATLYRSDEVVLRRPETAEKAGVPFTIRWKSTGEPDGWYRLVVEGFFESDGVELFKEVEFFHRAELPAEAAR